MLVCRNVLCCITLYCIALRCSRVNERINYYYYYYYCRMYDRMTGLFESRMNENERMFRSVAMYVLFYLLFILLFTDDDDPRC